MPGTELAATTKAVTTGTHRTRHPEHTWELVSPLLPEFGITRVSDVTGLDVLGVPVAMATRPLAKTLSVSQGKGRTYALAKVSAAMESVELWHGEHVRPPVRSAVAARDLDLPYAVEDVATSAGSLVDDTTPLDWVEATGLRGGEPVPLPADLARLVHPGETPWQPPGLAHTSNGLASGNCRVEATVHALYEVLERDALSRAAAPAGPPLDAGSLPEEAGAELVARIGRAGAQLDLVRVGSRFGVATFAARIWSPDFPLSCLGYGAHLSPEVAASRAITEAAQSRLTSVAGSRDDLADLYGRIGRDVTGTPPAPAADPVRWEEAVTGRGPAFADLADELDWLCAAVGRVAGVEPLLVDLSTRPEFAVVKVVVPGAGFDRGMVHPGRSPGALERLFGPAAR